MNNIHLLIVGSGKMAKLIDEQCSEAGVLRTPCPNGPNFDIANGPGIALETKFVAVHVGSGRVLEATIEWCEANKVPLIQASSGIKLPEREYSTIIIDAPNMAPPVVAIFKVLPELGALIQKLGAVVTVTESHQSTKTSPPVTAQKIGGYFGLSPGSVESIRDQDRQRDELHIPEEFLDGHGCHYVEINSRGVRIKISTEVFGRLPYFDGLIILVKKIVDKGSELKPGIYKIENFLSI